MQNVEKSEAANEFYKTYLVSILQDVFAVLTDTFHKPGFGLQAMILAKLFGVVESGSGSFPRLRHVWLSWFVVVVSELLFAENMVFVFDSSPLFLTPSSFRYRIIQSKHFWFCICAVTVPLWGAAQQQQQFSNNQQFIRQFVEELLRNAFQQVTAVQIQQFVQGLFQLHLDIKRFKQHLRDFLVQLKEFSSDNEELFREEREQQQQQQKAAEEARLKAVPGLDYVPPSMQKADVADIPDDEWRYRPPLSMEVLISKFPMKRFRFQRKRSLRN